MHLLINKHLYFYIFSLFYFSFSLITYKDYGITSDEQLEYDAGKTYFTYLMSSKIQRKEILSNVSIKSNPESFPYFRFYPGLISLLNFNNYYEWAHLLNLIFAFAGFVASYSLCRHFTDSKWSVLAPLLMFLNPHYFGHIPANPKDIPFATLYIICLFLIVRLDFSESWHLLVVNLVLSFLIPMRILGITLLPILVLKLFGLDFGIKHVGKQSVKLLSSVIFITAATYIIWPYLWDDPFGKVVALLANAKEFSYWDRLIPFNGELVSKDQRPWYYLFTYLALKVPIVISVGYIGSLFVKSRDILLLHLAVVSNIVLYLFFQPVVYNELRHFLFLLPILTVLATVSFTQIVNLRCMLVQRIALLLLAFGLAKLSYDFTTLHPYQYIYYNELGGKFKSLAKNYEFDYWSASYKDGAKYLRNIASQHPGQLNVYTCNVAFGVDYYSYKLFNLVNSSERADYIICDHKNALINNYDYGDDIVFEVVRKDATLSYVAKTTK